MALAPAFPHLAGMLPILDAAKKIVEENFLDMLAWRRSLDGSSGAVPYERIEEIQQHSKRYPLLIIQAATDSPLSTGVGKIENESTFDCVIWLTKSIDTSSNFNDQINELARELIRYYDATRMCFLSAPDEDWTEFWPTGNNSKKLDPWCSAAVFGQLEESTETAGVYAHSVSFELRVKFTEAQA